MKREFKWIATFSRPGSNAYWLKPRRYTRISNSVPRAVYLLMMKGQPGDVVEIASADFGFQAMTVKLHVGGGLTITNMIKE